jgi:hypothetical protein
MNGSDDLIEELNNVHPWGLAKTLTAEEAEALMAEKLNRLIRDDFGTLVQLLYRIDVEEPRLRYLLQQHKGEDAGKIIAGLIIQRLQQKIITRKQFREKNNNIPEDDRW